MKCLELVTKYFVIRRKYCIFYAEDGGFRSTNEMDETTDKVYFIGVIDILTPYNYVKKTEHFLKSFTQNKVTQNQAFIFFLNLNNNRIRSRL